MRPIPMIGNETLFAAAPRAGSAEDLDRARALHRAGEFGGAVAAYRSALSGLGDSPAAYVASLALARACSDAGKLEDAEAACRRALRLRPGEPNGLAILAMILVERGRLDEAAAAVSAALGVGAAPLAMHNLATAIALRRGLGTVARDLARGVLGRDRYNQRALADLALAAVLTDDALSVQNLLDLDALVKVLTPPPPPGYAAIDAFEADLADAVVQSPALDRSGAVKTMQGGARLPDAFSLRADLASGLRFVFAWAIDAYVADLRIEDAHPVRAGRPDRGRIVAWANLLEAQAHERAHIHESGWISGVYYVEMPEPDRTSSDAGALKLGSHHYGADVPAEGPTRVILPRPGRLILFPSYLCHRSLPFSGAGRRISFAFDVQRATPF